jgi:cytochrome c oxidase subunit II
LKRAWPDSTTPASLQVAVDYLKANPAAVVNITGFADKSGAATTNEDLAKERAKAVRDALVAAGIPESRTNLAPPMSVSGGGGSDDPEARRVEIRPKG